jgi:hypothetical protein
VTLQLVPVRVKISWNPSSSTASRPRFATCDDGLDYCIKHDEGGAPVRANEWVCTGLASAAGIAVPAFSVVEDLDRKLLFGSQIFGEDTNDNLAFFQSGSLDSDHLAQVWKTFAFDLFVKNEDRHVNNYKIYKQNRRDRIISFDWGTALFCHWPNMDLPLPHTCNTILNIRGIATAYGGLRTDVANEVLDRLDSIEGSAIVSTIRQLPRGWLDSKRGGTFTKWFGTRPRRERIAAIREGLRNGSYL